LESCGSNTVPVVVIVPVQGDSQTGLACHPLADSIAVILQTPSGQPDGGATVTWASSSGGSMSPAISVTNAQGIARTQWKLGCAAGTQRGFAITSAALNPGSFTATALPDSSPPQFDIIVDKVHGDLQSGAPCTTLAESLTVFVHRADGTPLNGSFLTWTTATNGAFIQAGQFYTNAQGLASGRWTLDCFFGNQTVTVTLENPPAGLSVQPATFTAMAASTGLAVIPPERIPEVRRTEERIPRILVLDPRYPLFPRDRAARFGSGAY
jgi:hypothetical protein